MAVNSVQQEGEILKELKVLNVNVAKQVSLWRMFVTGIVYGVGFFVGSAIIATIALGIFGPYIAEISWVRNAFQTGSALIR